MSNIAEPKQEAIDDADEVTVTMRKGDWRVVEEVLMPYDDDWEDDGTLRNKKLERIRQKLIIAAR